MNYILLYAFWKVVLISDNLKQKMKLKLFLNGINVFCIVKNIIINH